MKKTNDDRREAGDETYGEIGSDKERKLGACKDTHNWNTQHTTAMSTAGTLEVIYRQSELRMPLIHAHTAHKHPTVHRASAPRPQRAPRQPFPLHCGYPVSGIWLAKWLLSLPDAPPITLSSSWWRHECCQLISSYELNTQWGQGHRQDCCL